jgi:PhnB protein
MARRSKTKTKAKAKAKSRTKKSAVKAKARKTARPKSPARRKAARKKAAPKRNVVRLTAGKVRRPEVPAGYSSVTAYLVAQDAAGAIDYYKTVFGAKEELRMPSPGGRIGHAELRIGDSKIMLADEHPEMNARGPRHHHGSPVTIMLYVSNVDATVARAVEEGGKLLRAVKDQFYGDRSGSVEDPEGHVWHIATHVEDVPPKEIQRRMAAMMKEAQPPEAAASAAMNTVTEPA